MLFIGFLDHSLKPLRLSRGAAGFNGLRPCRQPPLVGDWELVIGDRSFGIGDLWLGIGIGDWWLEAGVLDLLSKNGESGAMLRGLGPMLARSCGSWGHLGSKLRVLGRS